MSTRRAYSLNFCKYLAFLLLIVRLVHTMKRTYYTTYSQKHNTTFKDLDAWIAAINHALESMH